MKTLGRTITLVVILIGIYLFVKNGTTTVGIIKALGGAFNDSVRNLQGRG